MDSRECLLTALDGGQPDRIPCALSFYRVDLEVIIPPGYPWQEYINIRFIRFPISNEERELSRIAKPYAGDTRLGTISQVDTYQTWRYRPQNPDHRNPLARAISINDLRDFPFPDLNKPYYVDGLKDQVSGLHNLGLAAGGNLPHLGGELFEAAWRLRGLENFLTDLLVRPDWAEFLLDRLTDLACRNAGTLAGTGIDVLALDDDVGMPSSMMISPQTWRRFFKSRLERIILTARAISPELRILYHSDGYFEPIIPDLIEIGVNAINPLQPDHMDAARIRRRFGSRLALWGTVGTHTAFSFHSPDQIRKEVKMRVDTLGRAGLIMGPAYDIDEPDIPWENLESFFTAVKEFG